MAITISICYFFMPINHIDMKCTGGSKLIKLKKKIKHLMYMDNIQLFAKNKQKKKNCKLKYMQWEYTVRI